MPVSLHLFEQNSLKNAFSQKRFPGDVHKTYKFVTVS